MSKSLINRTVKDFYIKATSDVMIGYHFRKLVTKSGLDPLRPPIESFSDHLPRINAFWERQLLVKDPSPIQKPFDLISVHKALQIRRGELGRWVQIFLETLEDQIDLTDNKKELEFLEEWRKKIRFFEKKFIQDPHLFGQD